MAGIPLSQSTVIKALKQQVAAVDKRVDDIEVPPVVPLPKFVIGIALSDAGVLVVSFSDNTTIDIDLASLLGGLTPIVATLDNTFGLSTLTLDSIPGLLAQVNAIADRQAALDA